MDSLVSFLIVAVLGLVSFFIENKKKKAEEAAEEELMAVVRAKAQREAEEAREERERREGREGRDYGWRDDETEQRSDNRMMTPEEGTRVSASGPESAEMTVEEEKPLIGIEDVRRAVVLDAVMKRVEW